MASKNIPQDLKRYITTHDSTGKSIFSDSVPPSATFSAVGDAEFFLGYATNSFPPALQGDTDISTYVDFLNNPPGLVVSGGTVLRIVDMKPGLVSPMHRTVSLDYGIVLEGEVELVLDSGETRSMKKGDIAVQRGTMHSWKVPGEGWARMLFVMQAAQAVEVDGEKLDEDLGAGIDGLRQSS